MSSDDVFDVIAIIDRHIDLAQIDADHPDQNETRRWIKVMRHCNDVLALHAAELRREMGPSNKRQPGSNVADEPRGK